MIYQLLFIALGGAIGTLLRYGINIFAFDIYAGKFPLGTFLVNAIGSFIIGFMWSLSNYSNFNDTVKTFVFAGLLGGFTTFSSYSLETFHLFNAGEIQMAFINILSSNIAGLLLCYTGYFIANNLTAS